MPGAGGGLVYFNGVHGDTGEYLLPPLPRERLAEAVRRARPGRRSLARLQQETAKQKGVLTWSDRLDLTRPESAGWALVFHGDEPDEVRRELAKLAEHRASRVPADRLKVLDYHDGETAGDWLARHDVEVGSPNPRRVPFYLLLAGSPERIPFHFGHDLAVEYAVGRLHFDTPAEYGRYVESLVAHESATGPDGAKEAVFFAPRHDPATELSADLLVDPLVSGDPAADAPPLAEETGFRVRRVEGKEATRERLQETLAAPPEGRAPALLFTASHGVGYSPGDPRQREGQGALYCETSADGGMAARLFGAAEVPAEARVHGTVAFFFACFSAGTPERDRFTPAGDSTPAALAPAPFVSALPRALLAHPRGGALACIGHVDRAWGFSIAGRTGLSHVEPFRNALGRILRGRPVGWAVKDFGERYAALSSQLGTVLENVRYGLDPDEEALVELWMSRNDAGGYLVVGDPAACLVPERLA